MPDNPAGFLFMAGIAFILGFLLYANIRRTDPQEPCVDVVATEACDHPDHTLVVEDSVALCRCATDGGSDGGT